MVMSQVSTLVTLRLRIYGCGPVSGVPFLLIDACQYIAVEESKERKFILICTMQLVGHVPFTLTSNTKKWAFIVFIPRQIGC